MKHAHSYTLLLLTGCLLAILASLARLPQLVVASSGRPRVAATSPLHQSQAQAPTTIFLPLIRSAGTDNQPPDNTVYSGDATFYGATGAGNCAFDATPDDLMVVALNDTNYANAALCGAYIEVTGPKGVVVVRVVDRCPECASGDVDLSREAFALIANPIDGRVRVTWHVVSPEIEGPIVYHFKDGSNPYWTAVQIRNHRNPIASFEYQDSNGQFRAVPRELYNYFVEAQGMGPGPYTFRVTDSYGATLTDSGITLMDNGDVSGSAQFPAP